MSINPRNTALKILYDVETDLSYLNLKLKSALENGELSSVDKRFITELVHGTVKMKINLDYIISKFSKLKLKKISPWVINILRMGVYQIYYMDKVPSSAAVNESVKLAKKYANQGAVGFVNGTLRAISKCENIEYPKDKIEYLSAKYSYPMWICKRWVNDFGFEKAEMIMIESNDRPNVYFRTNTLKTDVETLKKLLEDEGVMCDIYQNDYLKNIDYCLVPDKTGNISELDAYKKGLFYVQDVGAAQIVEALAPKKGETIIDMCAAPGGKTTHIAEKMGNDGKIYAFDVYDHKIKLINDNAKRLGIDIIDVHIGDGLVYNESLSEIADKVLVDAPCSGLGIISRKPDIKYLRKEEDIEKLADISYNILQNASKYVKKGGTIVFSTCTIDKTENENLIEKFLAENKEFYLEPITEYDDKNSGYITLYPSKYNDGFFICKVKRR